MTTDPILCAVQDYIKSGEYFIDARKWYNTKYLVPFSQRSIIYIICASFAVIVTIIAATFMSSLPTIVKVRYMLLVQNSYNTSANIIRADYVLNNPLSSIADIMTQDYVKRREQYVYDALQEQFTFIQSNSSKLMYKKFYNAMNIDNVDSPILKYRTDVTRTIKILSSRLLDDNKIVVKFESLAKTVSGDIVENKIWDANVSFDIDNIDIEAQVNSRFNFTVTNYRVKELANKHNK